MSDDTETSAERTQNEVEKTTVARRKNWAIAAVIIIASGALLAGGVYAVIDGDRTNAQLCRTQAENRALLRQLLSTSRRIAIENSFTIEQADRIRENYARLFAVIPPLRCVDGKPVEPDDPVGGG